MITTPLRMSAVTLLALSAALAPGAVAQESEEILSYDVIVELQADGKMWVTEEITVRALGDQIRRGIYRDFPTRFPRPDGWSHIVAPFRVLSVRQDGGPARYEVLSIGGPAGRGGIRVRIGDPDVFLSRGIHTYSLTYETERWVLFGADSDQLYWNVTGNGWAFPILSASARVSLPGALSPDAITLEGWTGPEGSQEQELTWSWEAEPQLAVFQTAAPLGIGEGLTVRLTFPKGLVQEPTPDQRAAWFRLDWGPYVDAGFVLALVIALYLLMWVRVGRDPRPGTTVVQYEPPEGFSPAALGYLKERGYEDAQLSAALVSLAVKGAIRIEHDGRDWTLHRTGRTPGELAAEESRVLEKLLGRSSELKLSPSKAQTVRGAIGALKRSLSARLERHYFVNNRWWFAAGLLVSVAGFVVLVWRYRFAIDPEAWFLGVWITFWSVGVTTLLIRLVGAWKYALGPGGVGAWAGAIFTTLFATPFVAAEIFVGALLITRLPRALIAAGVLLGVVNAVFYHLLERPTLKGRGV
ncbi:MAG TPA: DUF2207 domain-containing protein, partial [Gemmatimonadota bacterium]|nr:DUF2207 domain-containing protein [Gemmatimonadota bacterium]